jgi:hypothetical protein
MIQVFRNAVGHRALKLGPDKLVRVELRRIGREGIRVQARIAVQEMLNESGLMGAPSVPEQDHWAQEVAQEMPKEIGHFRGPDVLVGMEPRIQGQTLSLRGDAESRDGRELGPTPCDEQIWSLSPRSPSPGNIGDEQESAFIEEDQMGPKRCGLFLYGATRTSSSRRSPPRCAPGLASAASGSSNRDPASISRCDKGDTPPRTAWRLPLQSVLTSTRLFGSRLEEGLVPEASESAASGQPIAGVAGQESVEPEALGVHACGRTDANARPNSTMFPSSKRWIGRSCRTSAEPWPGAFGVPTAEQCLEVSCIRV